MRVYALAFGLTLTDCRADPPPSLRTAAIAVTENDAGEAEVVDAKRDLWFAKGPGRLAILAREQQDHAEAVRQLEALLATKGIAEEDRGAGELLLGLEDVHRGKHGEAAERFARARKTRALAPLELRIRALEAQARLDAGQPEVALRLLAPLPDLDREPGPLASSLRIALADAKQRTGDPEGARADYEAYLAAQPKGARRFEVMAKLARLLAGARDIASHRQAIEHYEALLLQTPTSDFGEEAARELPKLRAWVGVARSGREAVTFERDVALARVEAELERHRYKAAVKSADQLLRERKLSAAEKCRLYYVKGSALFQQRERVKARPVFDQAARACADAGKSMRELEVKSRYQAARGRYAEGAYVKAAQGFESLGREHAGHSYADDAWVLAGESWASHGDREKARAAFEAALGIAGDKREEARRRLLLLAFEGGDENGALALCDAALKESVGDPSARAKLLYFRGRALGRLGRKDEAAEAWVEAVRAAPLDYPALLSLSRLHEQGASDQGIVWLRPAVAVQEGAVASSTPPRSAERALLLARLGLGDAAREELAFAGVEGWPAVAVLDQAGLYPEAQRLLASLGSQWRSTPPASGRSLWELAHPRPFAELVAKYEMEHRVPHLLAYAVMQTESRFDPSVTSWAGARGLIQLMPATAKAMATSIGKTVAPEELFDPRTNLELGMLYLSRLVDRFGGGDAAVALAIPSYNAGAGAVERWLTERGSWDLDLFIEAIPYDETRNYTQRVLGRFWSYRWLYAADGGVPHLPLALPAIPGKSTAVAAGEAKPEADG